MSSSSPTSALSHSPDSAPQWEGHPKGSRAYRRILAGLGFAGLATFAQLYSTQSALPTIAADLGTTAAGAGLTVSAATLGLAAAVIPWSFIADRTGRTRAMAIAIISATILGFLVPLSGSLEVLLAFRFVEGMALGGIPAVAIAYLNEEVSRGHAAVAAGTYVAGTTLGGLTGRLIAGPASDIWGWRAGTLAVTCVAGLAAIVFLLLLPRSRGFTPSGGAGFRASLLVLASHLRTPGLVVIYAQAFLLMGGFVTVYNYLGFRLAGPAFGLSGTVVSLIFLAYLSGTVSSRWAAGLTLRHGRRRVLLCGSALMAAGLIATLSTMLPVVLGGLVVFTAGFFAAHGVASGWAGALPSRGRGQSASLYNLAYYLGSSIVGWAGGLVFQWLGWSALVVGTLFLTVLAALLMVLVRPQGSGSARH